MKRSVRRLLGIAARGPTLFGATGSCDTMRRKLHDYEIKSARFCSRWISFGWNSRICAIDAELFATIFLLIEFSEIASSHALSGHFRRGTSLGRERQPAGRREDAHALHQPIG